MSALRLVSATKFCKTCNEEKLTTEFSLNNATKDKLQYNCRTCDNKRQIQRRQKNPDVHLEYHRKYQRNKRLDFEYRLQMLINASKQRAKSNNREHNINVEDIKAIYPIDGCCPIFGLKLEFNGAGFRDSSPSIDRIDSTKGYTRDNIQVISWKANRIKGAASLQDLEMLVAYLKQGE
jgi:hypothetical protein